MADIVYMDYFDSDKSAKLEKPLLAYTKLLKNNDDEIYSLWSIA